MIKKLLVALTAIGLTFGLAACGEPTEQQKEAKAWRDFCDKNPQNQECKDWEQKYGMGG